MCIDRKTCAPNSAELLLALVDQYDPKNVKVIAAGGEQSPQNPPLNRSIGNSGESWLEKVIFTNSDPILAIKQPCIILLHQRCGNLCQEVGWQI